MAMICFPALGNSLINGMDVVGGGPLQYDAAGVNQSKLSSPATDTYLLPCSWPECVLRGS